MVSLNVLLLFLDVSAQVVGGAGSLVTRRVAVELVW